MFAYLDAGSGSALLAALAGGTAGAAVLVRSKWNRVRGRFGGGSGNPVVAEQEQVEPSPEVSGSDR